MATSSNNFQTQNWGVAQPYDPTGETSVHPLVQLHSQYLNGKMSDEEYKAQLAGNKAHEVPDMIPDSIRQIYMKQAEDQLHPWFQNETNYGAKSVGNATGQNEADYQNTIDSLNQGLEFDTNKLNTSEGANGTWASGARAERLNSLANQYQNKYTGAYNSANANAQNALTIGEYKYGKDLALANQPKFSQYNVNQTGQVSQGQQARYNPFGGQGTLNVGMQSAANTMAGDYLGARIKNPNYQVRK